MFIDADKAGMAVYFEAALRLARPGALLVADNVVRDGAVLDPDEDGNVQGVRSLVEMLAARPGITATALQTVGAKGYDGFILARVPG